MLLSPVGIVASASGALTLATTSSSAATLPTASPSVLTLATTAPNPTIFSTPTTTSGNSSVTEYPSVNLFINDGFDGDAAYEVSIITACVDQTVYLVKCTSGPADAYPSTCGPDAPALTLTEGPSSYIGSYTVQGVVLGEAVTEGLVESCALSGTTAADCHGTIFAIVAGTTTSSVTETSLTGTDYHRFQVAITGGADKTASATGSCKKSGAMHTADSRGAVVVMAALGALSLAAVLAL